MHQIYRSFVLDIKVGSVFFVFFFRISKASEAVWHDGLIQKQQQCGVSGNISHWKNS